MLVIGWASPASSGQMPRTERRPLLAADSAEARASTLSLLRRLGVDERHAKSLGSESGESKGERHADEAAAGNDDVVLIVLAHAHILKSLSRGGWRAGCQPGRR